MDASIDIPRQATLRRAVSTAYYALFHLLISEATLNWHRAEFRPSLGRIFEHGKMKNASSNRISALNAGLKRMVAGTPDHTAANHLLTVASAFLKAHQEREDADYNTARVWTPTEAGNLVRSVSRAFDCWKVIRNEPAAQEYLVSLLGKQSR